MFNQVFLIGRLGGDPVVKDVNNKAVAKFSLATDNGYGENKKTDWHNIVAWEKTAEAVEKYLRKGSLVMVSGRIQTRKYEKDGKDVYVTEIIANTIKFLDTKDKDDDRDRGSSRERDSRSSERSSRSSSRDSRDRDRPSDDDIPF